MNDGGGLASTTCYPNENRGEIKQGFRIMIKLRLGGRRGRVGLFSSCATFVYYVCYIGKVLGIAWE